MGKALILSRSFETCLLLTTLPGFSSGDELPGQKVPSFLV